MSFNSVDKLHLNLTSNFVSFISENQFCELLVPHICRSVNFSAQISNISTETTSNPSTFKNLGQSRRMSIFVFWFKKAQITANMLKNAKTMLIRRSISCHFQRGSIQSDHIIGKPAKSVKRFGLEAFRHLNSRVIFDDVQTDYTWVKGLRKIVENVSCTRL